MSNENLAAEAVASRILDLVAGFGQRGNTVTAESVLGRDLGLDCLDTVELIIDVECEFDIDLSPSIGEGDDEDFMVGLTVQAVIDAALKALVGEGRAESTTASIPVENTKPELLAAKLTPEDIEAVIVSEHYFTASQGVVGNVDESATDTALLALDHVTFCVLILLNGTKVTGVNHGPVSAANFDAAKGREYARKNAVEKVWELEGYALRERLTNPTSLTLNLSDEQRAELLEQIRNAPVGSLEVVAEPDADIIRFTNGDDGVFAHVTAPSGKHYGINLEHMACDADDELNLVGKFFRAVVDRVKAGAQLTDSDSAKGAQLLAIVREFVEKHRISFPEVIHQTDRVIENAYGLIQDLVDVAGYLPEEDEA